MILCITTHDACEQFHDTVMKLDAFLMLDCACNSLHRAQQQVSGATRHHFREHAVSVSLS